MPELTGFWDGPRLERVLGNLLGNAIKYSPDGGEITVRVTREGSDAGETAVFSVEDRGVGIPASDCTSSSSGSGAPATSRASPAAASGWPGPSGSSSCTAGRLP